jgi:2-polyprenyl-3-methyl-5-hydroxy-6-metoxy-1,4-benzoquinol methylase
MKKTICRVCGGQLHKEPLLEQHNMPAAAQCLPDKKMLACDKGIDLKIFQCSECGLIQLTNDPVPYYKEVIRAAAFSKEMKGFRHKQFNEFVRKYDLIGKKVVEIGCGRGEFLSIMKQAGVKEYGIEGSIQSVNFCKKSSLNVVKGFINRVSYKMAGAPFAGFYILNYLEHLPEPNVVLRGICNNLDDGGIGLVEVPNFDMVIQKGLFSEFISDHLLNFTSETLNLALNLNGFEVLESKKIWHEYIISAVVRKRGRLDMSSFSGYQAKLAKEINAYIAEFGHKRVAVWGAGHQALSVFSLARLSGKIRYVIDSAPFKQEKYTPATHIPIVSPDMLKIDPVDAIIIIAASYSDEVARTIRENYGGGINIAILRDYGLEQVT